MHGMGVLGAAAAVETLLGGLTSAPAFAEAAATAVKPSAKIAASAAKCVQTGLVCADHCISMLGAGNRDMAECLKTVNDVLAVCAALQKVAISNSKHLAVLAKAAATICADCAKACEPHAQKMSQCRDCMDACKECEKLCNSFA
jgi:Cys-rich four helix bundle protein (predicted Tat secretion target)